MSRAAAPEGTRGDFFSLDVLIKDVLNKKKCIPFHFRQYRGFSKHRVASIGSCFFVGIHVDIHVHIHRKHFVDLVCHAISLTEMKSVDKHDCFSRTARPTIDIDLCFMLYLINGLI